MISARLASRSFAAWLTSFHGLSCLFLGAMFCHRIEQTAKADTFSDRCTHEKSETGFHLSFLHTYPAFGVVWNYETVLTFISLRRCRSFCLSGVHHFLRTSEITCLLTLMRLFGQDRNTGQSEIDINKVSLRCLFPLFCWFFIFIFCLFLSFFVT